MRPWPNKEIDTLEPCALALFQLERSYRQPSLAVSSSPLMTAVLSATDAFRKDRHLSLDDSHFEYVVNPTLFHTH